MKRVIISLFIVLIFASCSKGEVDYSILKISSYETPFMAPIYLADISGYYIEKGIIIDLIPYTACSTALQDLSNNILDIAFSMDFPLSKALISNENIELISYLAHHKSEEEFIKMSDLSLEECIVGVTLNTNSEYTFDNYLRSKGFSIDNITLVDLRPEEMQQALINREINSLLTQTYLSDSIRKNKPTLLSIPLENNIDIVCISINTQHSSDKSSIITDFLIATNRAIKDLNNSREEKITTIEQKYKINTEMITTYQFGLGLDNHLRQTLKIQSKWLSKNSEHKPMNINTHYLKELGDINVTFGD